MFYKGTEIRAGNKIEHAGDIWVVLDVMHRTPGKGNALIQAKIRSLTTGRSQNERFKPNDTIARAPLTARKMDFLYRDENLYTFMDKETYDQVPIDAGVLGDDATFLTDGLDVMVQFHNDRPIGVELPDKVVLKIVETEPAVKGDTVNNVLKAATTETGRIVQVPLFVDAGETIRVSTSTGEYVERVK
jgi:elongation factor P